MNVYIGKYKQLNGISGLVKGKNPRGKIFRQGYKTVNLLLNVRPKGLEPPRLSALDPKSSAATNYATAAKPVLQINGSTCKPTLLL